MSYGTSSGCEWLELIMHPRTNCWGLAYKEVSVLTAHTKH